MSRDSSLENLYPPFADTIVNFNKKLRAEGIAAYPFETFRSFERQEELYAKGREKQSDGTWIVTDKSKIVTKAKPGFSFHAYGVATDYVFDGNEQKSGIQWSWDDGLPWNELGKIGKSLGLEWAGDWVSFKEFPHFQKTYGFKIHQLYDILMTEGLEKVWKEFDKVREKNIVVVPETIKIKDDKEEEQEEQEDKQEAQDQPKENKPIDNKGKKKSFFETFLDILGKFFKL